jgi:hypothetical protein
VTRAWPSRAAKRSASTASPGDVGLQRVAGLPRRVLAEDLVDQPVHRDDVPAPQQEGGEQRPLADSRNREGPAGDPDLERPQDAQLNVLRLPDHRGIIASLYASCTPAVGDGGQAAG